jgi:hypothetical protein
VFPVRKSGGVDHSKTIFTPEHTLRVKTVYHKLLRDSRSWVKNYTLWYEYAAQVNTLCV